MPSQQPTPAAITNAIPRSPRKWATLHPWPLMVGVPILAAILVAVILWNFVVGSHKMEPASVGKMAFPLPDKPSIAVLPFVNMSEDKAQEYLCDGITEEIITALSKCPFLFVISRNSTFTYTGKPVKVQQVAEDLGVRYVMEGSVRKDGERVRVTVQLNDAITGNHLWADRYNGEFRALFALEDEVTLNVLSALKIRFTEGASAQIRSKGTKNLDAYLKYLESRELLMRGNPSGFSAAKRAAEESIARDPDFTGGYRILAWIYLAEYEAGIGKSPSKSLGTAFELAQKICEMDRFDPLNYCVLGMAYLDMKNSEKALTCIRRAIELDPNSSTALYFLNQVLTHSGDDLEAIQVIQKAIRLNPLDEGFRAQCLYRLGRGFAHLGRNEEAIPQYEESLRLRPDRWGTLLYLAAAYALVGREEDARRTARELLRVHPTFTIAGFEKKFPYPDQELKEREFAAFRKAGLK